MISRTPDGGSCLTRLVASSTCSRIDGGGAIAVGQAEPGRGFPQPPDLFGAGRALLQVLLEFVELVTGQRVDGVDAGQQVEVVALDAHWDTSMQSRIRIRPSRIRVLTVPSGSPSSPATSG